MRIGAHVGVGRGWPQAAEYCVDVGAECLQVFSKSPRTWRASALDEEGIARFHELAAEWDVGPLFVHTSYLINMGSSDETLWHRSLDALAEEFRRAGVVGAAGLVTHTGTDSFGDRKKAAERIADAVVRAREMTDAGGRSVTLLLENTAGAGDLHGGSAEEIGQLAHAILKRDAGPVGVCLDTCHAFAFGYPLGSAEDWHDLLDSFEEACGETRIECVHANDSKFGLGEKRDRHEWIGDGHIGHAGFRAMFSEARLADIPVILEMPGDPPDKDRVNIARLRAIRDESIA